jgi:long-chain acyl-CoA synthetase
VHESQPANLTDLLRRTAERVPDAVALVADGQRITFGDLDASVDAVARGLTAHGVAPGDTVAVVLGSTPAFVEAYLGALRAGAVCAPLNPGYTVRELGVLLGAGAPVAVITGGAPTAAVRDAVAGLEGLEPTVMVTGDAGDTEASGVEVAFADVRATPGDQVVPATGGEDLAVLLFTSGSSSSPRAAMLTHRALLANVSQVSTIDPPVAGEGDVMLSVLPLFHVYGLNAVLGLGLAVGATVVLDERFDPDTTLALVAEHGATVLPVAPPMLGAWAHRDDLPERLAGVRVLLSGAAALPVHVQDEVERRSGLVVHQGYGLTEAAPVATTTMLSPVPKHGSIGRPLDGVEVRLVDDDGSPVEDGDPGEVVLRGPNLFSGYWPDGDQGPDAEGWWRTGDVAYADADGDLFLVDRVKDLVIVNGFNVYPREVEDVLLELAGVAEAAVVAVPSTTTGEAVKAIVVPEPGVTLTPEEVLEHCAGLLARFKRPTVVDVVPSLPRTSTGKIAKGLLRRTSAPVPGLR